MANRPPFATLNHFTGDLGIPRESHIPRVGITCYKPAVEHSLDDWNHELNNNLLSAFLTSRAVFPRMRDARGGAVINFARAGLPQANMVAYNCAKAGLEALTRTL